jgi:hypothetical protein
MAIKHIMMGSGWVLDRTAKKGKLALEVDVSPHAFLTESRSEKDRLTVTIAGGETEPIVILCSLKQWILKLEGAMVPKDRLADLETLITEEISIHAKIEYTPQEKLPGMDGEEKP